MMDIVPTRPSARVRAAATIRLVAALVLTLSAIALLTTTDAAVDRTRAALDLDPKVQSFRYLAYIETIVNYRHVVPAIAFLLAAVGCAVLGAAGLTGRLRSSADGWLLWGVAILAFCVLVSHVGTESWFQTDFDYERVRQHASQNEPPLARAAQFLGCLWLYAGLLLSNLLQSSTARPGSDVGTSADEGLGDGR